MELKGIGKEFHPSSLATRRKNGQMGHQKIKNFHTTKEMSCKVKRQST
jgi:hypothetical protein